MLEQPGFLFSVAAFLVVFTILVFVHELGHFWVARRCGVKVSTFSIGFGPALLRWRDRKDTEWRISAVPLGGYVKFLGDADGSSRPDVEALATLSEEDKKVSFPHKPLYQRAAVVAAGPVANLLFASLVFALIFAFAGRPMTPAVVDDVLPESAAESAGILPGDAIIAIDGYEVLRFQDIQERVLLNVGEPMQFKILRDGTELELQIIPRLQEHTDAFGKTQEIRMLGVSRRNTDGSIRQSVGPLEALGAGFVETGHYMAQTLKVVGQMIAGSRSLKDMGGPIKIGEVSGQAASISLLALISLAAILSVNLGLINLFPVPMLDGGHLLYYAFEAIFRRPLGERVQEYGFRIGLVAVLSLMLFVTWNDLVGLGVADGIANFFSGLFS